MSLALRVMGYKIKSLKILPPGSSRNCPMLLFNIPLSNCAVLLLALGYIKKGREGFCSVFLSWLIWLELAAADLWDQSQWFNNLKFLNKISFLWQPWVCVQLPSCMWLFVTPWTATYQASLSLTTSQSLPRFMSIRGWCCLTISCCLLSFPASGSFPMSQPKYKSFFYFLLYLLP